MTTDVKPWANPDGALLRIRDILTINLMVRQLLQPISVESYPNAFQYLIRSGIVGMEGLTWLHIFDTKTHKRIAVDGIPQVVESRTHFPLASPLIGEGVVRVNRYEMIPNVDWTLIAVLTEWGR
jgi:hypothetical protein